MPRTREAARDRARTYRAVKARLADEEAKARRARLSQTLAKVAQLLTDQGFIELAALQGVEWVPRRLVSRANDARQASLDLHHADSVLDFVIAWKFIFPMFANGETLEYLQKEWPGFVDEFKDTFIALVMNGPFLDERRTSLSTTFFQ
jgi:hypothetical protein